jgi:hypothetical protein
MIVPKIYYILVRKATTANTILIFRFRILANTIVVSQRPKIAYTRTNDWTYANRKILHN